MANDTKNHSVDEKSVFVTVVAFSDYNTVRSCLQSLLNQSYDDTQYDVQFSVLVNNPDMISPEKLEDDFPEIEITTPSRNIGYAGAIARCWNQTNSSIIVITNDDLTFQPGWLDGLLKPFENPNVFATTCSIINEGEDEETKNGTLNPIGIRIPDTFSDRTKALFPSGAAFAFRKDDVEPVDPSYFLYFEDVYLGLKARLRGFDIVMNPESKVVHKHKLSTSRMPESYLHYYQEKNRLANLYIFFEGWTMVRLFPYFVADFLIRIIQMITLKRRPDAVLRVWLYYITHVGTTIFKRYKAAETRKVTDSELLPYMSGKLLPGNSTTTNVINKIFIGYSKLVGLNFVETLKKND
ncbi:glycosyltransferase [bacterium]|nr:glycosyltransferase [bacterium]MBU1025704.1 glycosyltransferase [bacterium]